MSKTLSTLEFWAEAMERRIKDQIETYDFKEPIECLYGDKVCDDRNYWSNVTYSPVTGWQQILWFNDSPQKDHAIVQIKYYPSAYAALLDHSIFPAGSMVEFGNCWYGRTKQDRQNEIQN